MGQFDDIIGTVPKGLKKGLKIICKKCGSTNTEVSHKMYNGVVFNQDNKVYKRYRQFVRCYDCSHTKVITASDIMVDERPEDIINITNAISLPILSNVSPIRIWDEIMTGEEMEEVE